MHDCSNYVVLSYCTVGTLCLCCVIACSRGRRTIPRGEVQRAAGAQEGQVQGVLTHASVSYLKHLQNNSYIYIVDYSLLNNQILTCFFLCLLHSLFGSCILFSGPDWLEKALAVMTMSDTGIIMRIYLCHLFVAEILFIYKFPLCRFTESAIVDKNGIC